MPPGRPSAGGHFCVRTAHLEPSDLEPPRASQRLPEHPEHPEAPRAPGQHTRPDTRPQSTRTAASTGSTPTPGPGRAPGADPHPDPPPPVDDGLWITISTGGCGKPPEAPSSTTVESRRKSQRGCPPARADASSRPAPVVHRPPVHNPPVDNPPVDSARLGSLLALTLGLLGDRIALTLGRVGDRAADRRSISG